MTDKEKQIEESAKYFCLPCEKEYCGRCVEGFDPGRCTAALDAAEALYNAGYRKQIEGEWKKTCVPDVFQCTNCKRPTKMDELCDSEVLREFCPNCGAKMKGGERE